MKFLKSFWKLFTWAVIVLILSSVSGEKVSQLDIIRFPHIDKIVHFFMYFIFTLLALYDFSKYKEKELTWRQMVFFSLITTISYGGIMEILQDTAILHRSSDIKDFLANALGSISAIFMFKSLSALLSKISTAFIKPKNGYSL